MALLIQLVSGECPRHRNICVIHNFALLVCITPFSELIHFHDYLEGFILIKEKASLNNRKSICYINDTIKLGAQEKQSIHVIFSI